jgi:hypothetical protein
VTQKEPGGRKRKGPPGETREASVGQELSGWVAKVVRAVCAWIGGCEQKWCVLEGSRSGRFTREPWQEIKPER